MPNQRRNTFRLKGKNLFLTYAGIPNEKLITTQDVFNHLKSLDYRCDIQRLLVARESHKDNTKYHFHCFIGIGDTFQTRNQNFFDYDGLHPNIQKVRSPKRVIEYCTKDGNYLARLFVGGHELEWVIEHKVKWRDVLASNTKAEFMDNAAAASARDFVINYSRIADFANAKYASPKKDYVPAYTRDRFIESTVMTDWVTNNLEYV